MTVSIAAGKIQVLIGTDYQDWSACYGEFTAGLTERSDSGVLFTTGKLTLAMTAEAPTSMNPRTSSGSARFFKGQQVILNYDFGGGTWTRHPHGFLYILKPPLPPSLDNPYLELDLGCTLEYSNKPQPAKTVSRSGISGATAPPPGQGFSRGAGVLSSLQQAGIQRTGAIASVTSSISSGGGDDTIKDDVAKNEQTNWIEVAGKLAYGSHLYLYQDGYGVIQSCYAGLSAGFTPIATIEIGKDESSYEPSDGGEVPVESIVYGGVFSEIIESKPPTLTEFKVRGPASAVDPDAGSGQIDLRSTTITEDVSGITVAFSETSESARGALAPSVFPKDFGMDLDVGRVTTRKYDFEDGRLLRDKLTETRLYPVALSEHYSGLKKEVKEQRKFQKVTAKESETVYEYDPFTYVLKSITKTDEEAIAAICPEEQHDSPTSLRTCRLEITSWESVRPGEWRKSEFLSESFTRVQSSASYADTPDPGSRIRAKLALVPRYSRIIPSNTGKNQPPATERLPSKEKINRKDLRIEIQLAADKDFAGRQKEKNLDRGVIDNSQLARLAQIEGAVLLGRSQGAQIQLPILSAFLTDTVPLRNLAVIESEISSLGVRQNLILYQMDGREFSHEADQAVLTASLIWLGTQEGQWQPFTPIAPVYNAAAIVPPYSEIIVDAEGAPPDLVIIRPLSAPILSYRGLGSGRGDVELPMPKISSPILSPRGFGVGRGDFLNFLLFDRGFGVGRGDVELQIRLPISPILSPRGFGVSRSDANWVPIAIESLRGFGVGRGDAVMLASKLTDPISGDRGFGISKEDAVILSRLTLPPILSPRGFGVSRSDANRVPIAIESLRGFGAGRPDFRLWGLQEFAYSGSAPDQAGILYFWGTNFAQTTWINPSSRGAAFSWSASGSGSASNTVDRTSNATNNTSNTANSWVQLDCGATRTIRPVGYYLQHDGTAAGFLQNWKLQGSNNGSTWDDLDTRISDTSLNAANAFAFFSVPGVTTFYRYLRILQTGVNSSGSNTLTLSEWEFYGFFKY